MIVVSMALEEITLFFMHSYDFFGFTTDGPYRFLTVQDGSLGLMSEMGLNR